MPMILPLVMNAVCSGTFSDHQDVCNKILEAGARQSQLYDGSEKTENYITDHAKDVATTYLGKSVTGAIGSAGYVYKVYKDRSVSFKLPTLGVCNSVNNTITTNSYTINLKWNIW